MSRLNNDLYKLSIESRKLSSTLRDIEDLSKGNIDKVIKRKTRGKIHKEVHKNMNKIIRRMGL